MRSARPATIGAAAVAGGAVARDVHDGVDLALAQRGRVEEVGDRPVLGEIDPRVAQARVRARQEAVEARAAAAASPDGEDARDARIVEEQLHDPPPIGSSAWVTRTLFMSGSGRPGSCTARRTWLAR